MPNYSKILSESRNANEAISKWKSENNGTIDATVESSFKGEPSSNFKGGSNPQSSTTNRGNIADPRSSLNASANVKSGLSEKTETYTSPTGLTKNMGEEILKQIERESQLHTDINEKMGITGELSRAYRDSIIETVPNAIRLGFDIKNLTELTTRLSETSGRFNLISQDTMEKTVVTTRAFGTTMSEMGNTMSEFEKVGLGQSDTLAKINKAGKDSLSVGLNSKNVIKDIQTNLSEMNKYGFKNGVEGLTRMAQKATEFRMNMSETFKLAEKVMDPSDAIALTANMQMLGGAIGDLNDPLKLMYMATNNVEGLQDALQGAASTLATYNTEQKRFEITGANLRRAQEMAKVLGVDYKEFTKGAIAAQERILANDTLLSKGFDIDDKDREFLTNLSSMKDGEMQIVIPKSLQDSLGKELGANELKLSDLSTEQKNILINYRKQLEDKTPAEMAKAMFSETTKIAYNTEATARAFVIGAKDTTFGKEDRWKGPMAPIVETTSKLRKTQYGLTKDSQWMEKNNPIKGLVDAMDKVGVPLKVAVDNTVKSFEKLNDELLKMTRKYKTEEQEKIDKENERKQESSKAKNSGNASVNHYHTFKISKTNNLENYSIDQTSKGYTGNQTIPYDPDNMA